MKDTFAPKLQKMALSTLLPCSVCMFCNVLVGACGHV